MCLVSAYAGDMIPSEAMTKLKQKHPGTVRVAEEVRGSVVQDSPVQVVVGRHQRPGRSDMGKHETLSQGGNQP